MVRYHKINCNTCVALVTLFYSQGMSATVRSAIVYHLIKCDKCLRKYADFEANHEEYREVNIKKVILYLRKNMEETDSLVEDINEDIKKTPAITASFSSDSNSDGEHFNPTKWQDAVDFFDVETLMNLKCFRDLINTYNFRADTGDKDYSLFYRYVAAKMAKRVDLFEACLRKDVVNNS